MYEEIIASYSDKSLEELKQDFGDSVLTEIDYYQLFLEATDYISIKANEEYFKTDTKTTIREKYGNIINARQYARDKINELEEQLNG